MKNHRKQVLYASVDGTWISCRLPSRVRVGGFGETVLYPQRHHFLQLSGNLQRNAHRHLAVCVEDVHHDYLKRVGSSSIRLGTLALPEHAVIIRDSLGICDGCEGVHLKNAIVLLVFSCLFPVRSEHALVESEENLRAIENIGGLDGNVQSGEKGLAAEWTINEVESEDKASPQWHEEIWIRQQGLDEFGDSG